MRNRFLILTILTAVMESCNKDEPTEIAFTPTDFIISQMGPKMRISIDDPFSEHYAFSGDTSQFNYVGENFHVFQVEAVEMEELGNSLSDTIIFQWEATTAAYPYPEDECKIRVDRYGYGDFMCSIGKGKYASDIITGLSRTITGDPKHAFEVIAASLSD